MIGDDPFLDVKSSPESSKPRWLYEIRQSLLVVYRITGGERDITWNGYTWKAEQVASSEIGESASTKDFEVTLTLPIKHALVQRYLAQSSPPQRIVVTIYEYQEAVANAEQQWVGEVTGMELDMKAHTAGFRVPSRLTRALERRVSAITAGRACPHVLYGPDCRASDVNHRVATTVTGINGRSVVVASITTIGTGGFSDGDFAHNLTGETQVILDRSSALSLTFDLQAPIPDMRIGDAVVLRHGCRHDTTTCLNDFDNMPNYGGFPEMPLADAFVPGNKIGIYGGSR